MKRQLEFRSAAVAILMGLSLSACAPAPSGTTDQNQNEDPAGKPEIVLDVSRGTFADLISGKTSTLTLPVFNGQMKTLVVEKVEEISTDSFSIAGHDEADIFSEFTFIVDGDDVSGVLHVAKLKMDYEIQSRGPNQYVLVASAKVASVPCESDHLEPHEAAAPESFEGEEASFVALPDEDMAQAQAVAVIDMLVAYTPAAKRSQGGAQQMKALIARGIADTNLTFEKSGIRARVRLVGTMETRANESGSFYRDLDRVIGKTDGTWDEVHAERDRLGADQVTLIGAYNRPYQNLAGLAYNACKAGSGACYASKAFTVVKARYFNQYTFTHELGHNLGVNHWHGYLSRAGDFQTMMLEMSYGETRIRRFSNPTIRFGSYLAGDRSRNSAAIINRFVSQFSQFRNAKTGLR